MTDWITYDELLAEVMKNLEKDDGDNCRPESIISVSIFFSLFLKKNKIKNIQPHQTKPKKNKKNINNNFFLYFF